MMFRPETDWIKRWAMYTPTRMALREHDRDLSWSYAEFNRRANALAHHLTGEVGLSKGDRAAVYSRNRAEYVLLFEACVKTGIIMVPLNFRLMPRELDQLIADAEPSLFLFEQAYEESARKLETLKGIPNVLPFDDLEHFLTENVEAEVYEPAQEIEESDPVMILYTAGTTGLSKGAIITHKMLFWNSINTGLRLDLTSSDHTQSYAPFFHTGGWNVLLTPFFHHGGSHTLLQKFEPELVLELMEQEKTTLLFGVPTMLQMMADTEQFAKTDLSSVRYAIVGGAPMPEPLINTWHERGVMIRQGYGLTEVGPNCFSLHQDDAIRKRGSIGFPNFYVDAKVMDGDRECGADEVGELWMRGPMVTSGYWRKPEKTAEAITDGWFHTGDMVIRDPEGFYSVVDRKKNMYISGGENVYPADVERFLYTHPAVHEVAVIGVPDEQWGEVGHVFYSTKPGESLEGEELKTYCKGQLATFKTPRHYTQIDDLPKNDAGKINRIALRELSRE